MTSTLRSRLMSIVLSPAIVFLVLMCLIFTFSTLRDIAHQEVRSNQSLADQIAAHSYSLYLNNDLDGLQLLAQTSLEHHAIKSITFYDLTGKPLAHAGPIQPPLNDQIRKLQTSDLTSRSRQAMVTLPIQRLTTFNQLTAQQSKPETAAGWLQVQFSFTSLLLHNYQTFMINMFIALLLIGLTYTIVIAFTNRLAANMRKLTQYAQEPDTLQYSGNLQFKELQQLQNAILSLKQQQSERLKNAQQLLELAESDLYTTIETIEVKNIELDIARREAIRSNKSKSEFLANTSHELRTPLNSIIGFSNLLMRSCESPQQREHAQAIHDSSQNLLNLINDILDLSRLEANRFVLNNEIFDIRDTIESTLEYVASNAHLKALELSYSIYSDVPNYLVGDSSRLRQVLTNLVGNAIKFSDRGTIQVRISLEHQTENDAVIHFEVADQGRGLPNGKKQQLFAPFTQYDNSNTRAESGSGLGLSICNKLIQQMNGDIDYHSEPGNTRFWFTVKLPIAHDSLPEQEPLKLDCRVVVIDDNQQSLNTCTHLLASHGSEIVSTSGLTDFVNDAHSLLANQSAKLLFIAIPAKYTQAELEQLCHLCEQLAIKTILALPSHLTINNLKISNITPVSKPVTRKRLRNGLVQALQTPPSTPAAIAEPSLQGTKILVADDVINNAKLFQAFLAPHGAEILFAENGQQAVELYQNHQFDIALLDIQMPIMDGLEASQAIRQLEQEQQRNRIPILAVTAFSDNEQRHTIEAAGMDEILEKPITETKLIQAILQHLKQTDTPKTESASAAADELTDGTFSYSKALASCSGMQKIANDMITQLIAMLREEMPAIEANLAKQQWDDIQHTAHKIHGACAYCGTSNLQQSSREFEKIFRKTQDGTALTKAAEALLNEMAIIVQLAEQQELIPAN